MFTTIRRYSFVLTALIITAVAPEVQASTTSGFDTSGIATMPFAIEGNEVMNMQTDGLHFDAGKAIYGISSIGVQTSNVFRALTVGGGEIALVKQSNDWAFLNISDGNANGGGNFQIRGLTNGGSAGVNLGMIDLMANQVAVEGAMVVQGSLSANGGGGNGVYGNTSSGSAWGGVLTGPANGVYAYGATWAGYFDGPVNIASGGLHFPDGTVQTTAASAPSVVTVKAGACQYQSADAICPAGYVVTGCGFIGTVGWSGKGPSNPYNIYPDAGKNGCHEDVAPLNNCFDVVANCLRACLRSFRKELIQGVLTDGGRDEKEVSERYQPRSI